MRSPENRCICITAGGSRPGKTRIVTKAFGAGKDGLKMRAMKVPEVRGMEVRGLMTYHVFTLGPDDDLQALYDLMASRHVRHVPVVDREGKLVGLVTQRDLARSALGTQEELPLSMQLDVLRRRKIREIMDTEVETVEADAILKTAAETLIENKIDCLPVVDGGRLVGILTESDFVRHFAEKG